ncbi:MAG TPA: hypothetical protein VK207_05930 [Bacteroidales bacterium]|nr:hypothetical protein [Bacteroidales bacterium]
MKTENEKYEKIVDSLRKSTPELIHYDSLEEKIMRKISSKDHKDVTGIFDFLFGWIYIGWVRKTLIAVSFALLGFFLWQQNSIINQINDLSVSIRENDRMIIYDPSAALEKRQMLLKYTRERSGGYYVPEEDLKKIIDSLNHLDISYRDLLDLINSDSLLKKRVEEKLERKLGSRIKL